MGMGAQVRPHLPRGMIMLWFGSIGSIPAGWLLCNGSNGTPNLRDKFVVGAGSTYAVGVTGGSATHNHEINETHSHDIESGSYIAAGSDYAYYTSDDGDGVYTEYGSNLPPYHALCYIMKT